MARNQPQSHVHKGLKITFKTKLCFAVLLIITQVDSSPPQGRKQPGQPPSNRKNAVSAPPLTRL